MAHAANLTALVANNGGDKDFGSVTPVDIATNTLEGWGGVGGPNPLAIAFTSDGESAYVANEVGPPFEHGFLDQVLIKEHITGATISSIYDPWAIAITPDGSTAYVVNRDMNEALSGIVPVKLAGAEVGTAITIPKANAVAITPDGSTAYVTSGTGGLKGSVTPVALETGTVGTAIAVGTYPRAIAIAPDGSTAYVLNTEEESVTPIELGSGKAKSAIALPETIYASGIAIAPDGLTAYVPAQENSGHSNTDVIEPIDLGTDTVGTPILDGQKNEPPTDIAISPDGGTAYVTELGGELIPIDLSEGKAGTPIKAGGPYEPSQTLALAIQPDQAPIAKFTTTPAPPGKPTKFDASSSTVSFGSITSYEWEFGDGQKETTPTPETMHVYAEAKTYQAKLTVTDSAGTSTAKVYTGQMMMRNGGPNAVVEHSVVIGSSSSPKVTLSTETLPFGEVEVGQTKGPEAITVENSGSGELLIGAGGVQLAGSNPSAYKLGSDDCPAGEKIAPTHHCSFQVSFAPSAPGAAPASVEIEDNANGSPQKLTLTGTGIAASVQLSSASLEFGQIAAGEVSPVQVVRLSNGGSAPLRLGPGAVTLAGAQPEAFRVSEDTCSGQTVPAAGSCSVAVTFAPSTAGSSYAATLAFADSAPGSPQMVLLSGSTPAPPPPAKVAVSPGSLSFLSAPGATSASQTVYVSNGGGLAAHVSGVSFGGADPSAFKIITNSCVVEGLMALGGRCTITVAFAPPAPGTYSATLLVADDAPSSPQSVALSGETTGTITGTVLDTSAGNAPVHAQVEAFCVHENELCAGGRPACEAQITCRSVFTGADGSYALTDLSPGTWHIDIYPLSPSLSSGSANVSIGSTAGAVANFALHTPHPLSGGVSFAGPNGETEAGVPTVYYNHPFSFKIPVRIGPGAPNETEVFLVTTALGNEGAAGGQGGGFNLAGAALFSVHYDASGRPKTMSQIMVGQLECGPPAQPSPCAAFGTAAASAGAHATAARVPPGASLLQGGLAQSGLALGHIASCGGPPGFRNGTAFGFEISPTTNGGIQIEMSVVPFQPPVAFIFDPVGIAPWSPTGNGLANAAIELGIGTINKFGSAVLPGLSAYNTLTKVLSAGVTAAENPTAGNLINAALQTYVTQLNVEDHGMMYYAGSYGKGVIGKVLKEKSEGTVPGNTEGPFTGPGPGKPCEEKSGAGGGGAPGGGGGSGSETYGGEGYIDPSGLVQSPGHVPIAGAIVTLTRAASATGRQIPVPNGSTLMSPSNRRNPSLTNPQGAFGWDVQPGYYQIDARRSGCRAARGASLSRSAVDPVPPPQTNLMLTLKCPHLRRDATHLRLRLVRGIDGTNALRVTVSSSRRRRSRAGDYVGTIVVRSAAHILASVAADPRTGFAVVDLPRLAAASHSVTVSFSGNGLLSPSSARTRLG